MYHFIPGERKAGVKNMDRSTKMHKTKRRGAAGEEMGGRAGTPRSPLRSLHRPCCWILTP